MHLDHQLSLDASSYARTIALRLVVRHAPIQSRPGQGENTLLRCKAFSHGVSDFEAVKEWWVVYSVFYLDVYCQKSTILFLNLVFKRPLIMFVAKPWHLLPMILLLARDSSSSRVRFICNCLGTNQMRLRSLAQR